MRTHRTSRRLTNRTDVTGPAATGIHPNCIRSLRDTASRLPRVDTLRRSSLPKFHDLAECGPRALAAQLRRRAPALRPVAVGRGPWRCALRAAPPAARCRAVPRGAAREGQRQRHAGAARAPSIPLVCVGQSSAFGGGKKLAREAARGCGPGGGRVDGATGIRLPRGRRLSVHSFHLHH